MQRRLIATACRPSLDPLGATEGGERDDDEEQHDDAVWNVKDLWQRERSARRPFVERAQRWKRQTGGEHTGPHPEHERDSVQPSSDGRNARCAGTEAAQRETDT